MKAYTLTLSILISISTGILHSQNDTVKSSGDTTDLRRSNQGEKLLEDLKSDEEESVLLDQLEYLKRNPYDLNKVTQSQLENIPFLNSIIAKNILEYRKVIKAYNSKRELLKIEGITDDLYDKIKTYLIVRHSATDILIDETGRKYSSSNLNGKINFKNRIRSRILQDLQPKEGFLNDKYEGTRPKIYNQFNTRIVKPDYNIEANITSEKDAGEKNITDFVSGFFEMKDLRYIKDIVAGDYTLNFGQGLAMWSSQSFSKGTNTVNPLKKKGKGIDGYGSVNEVQFFRGGAVKLIYNNFSLNMFYSKNFYDASIDTTTDGVSSFYYDGYHRTSSEIRRKNSAEEKLFGGRITFEKGSLRLGTTYWRSRFSKLIIPDSQKYLYKFAGTSADMLGADYDFIIKNMNFYGEFARSQSNSIASFNAVQFTFYKTADLLFSYRNYPKDFAPVHSSGFGEKGSDTYNERGFYAGITIRPLKGLIVNSYFDQFEFPYKTYFNPVPTSGNDFLTDIEWRAARGLAFNFKYKNENKEEMRTVTDNFKRDIKITNIRDQLNVRAGFIYHITNTFRLRSCYDYVNINYKNTGGDNKGHLFFSDITINPITGFVINTRFIFFDTDDYDSRIFEFENDILGVMSNVALYGKGRRWYLLVKYKPLPFFEIEAKYAETYFDGVKSIGSGNDEINGDVNNRLGAGIEIIF